TDGATARRIQLNEMAPGAATGPTPLSAGRQGPIRRRCRSVLKRGVGRKITRRGVCDRGKDKHDASHNGREREFRVCGTTEHYRLEEPLAPDCDAPLFLPA